MKQNAFKSRWLIGTVSPHCSGEKQMNTLKRQAPKVKKKKNSLEVVACWNKDAEEKRKEKEYPFKYFDYRTCLKNNIK